MLQVNWKAHRYDGAKLGFLLTSAGMFHDAHRAVDDCHALVEILSRPLTKTSKPAFAELMANARRPSTRIWAERSPFELKDQLKQRGYRWNDGADGSPKSWYIDVTKEALDAETDYLKKEIYQRNVDIRCREFTAFDRFSNRG